VEPRRTAVQRTHRVLLVVLGVLFLVLLATGLWLSFRYQPSGSFVGARPEGRLRLAHRVTSTLFLVVALAWFGLSIAVSYERLLKRGTPVWAVGVVGVVGALGAMLTGHLLPWDVLALPPLRRGEFRGFGFLFRTSNVHSVLVGSLEVGRATLRRWFLVHTVAVPLGLMALGVVGWRVTRRSRLRPESSSPGESPPPPDAP
jgi:quinol-cytochrome oxidoreductase complex cytochrome b subunit